MSSESNSLSFFKNVLSFSYASIITAAIGFFIIPFATRLFPPSEMGKINLFSTVASLCSMLAIAGIDQAYVRYHAESSNQRVLTRDSLQLSLIIWLIVSVIILILREYLSTLIIGYYSITLIVVLILYILFTNIQRFSSLDYRLRPDAFNYTMLLVLHSLANNVLFYFVAFWNKTAVVALGIKTLLVILLSLFYILFMQRAFYGTVFNTSRETEKSRILKFGLPLLPASIFYWINGSVAKFILTRYWGYDAVGIFGIGLTLSSVVGIMQTGFNTFWAPYSMKNYKTELLRIQKVHHYIVCILSLFVLCLMLFQDIIFLLLGASYRVSQMIFPFFLITHVLYTISETTGLGIPLSGKTYFQALLVFLSMAINIVLCFVLIPKYGLVGSAISILIADLVMVSLRTILGQKYYKSVNSLKRTIITVIVLLITASLNLFASRSERIIGTLFSLLVVFMIYRNEISQLVKVLISFIRTFLKKANDN